MGFITRLWGPPYQQLLLLFEAPWIVNLCFSPFPVESFGDRIPTNVRVLQIPQRTPDQNYPQQPEAEGPSCLLIPCMLLFVMIIIIIIIMIIIITIIIMQFLKCRSWLQREQRRDSARCIISLSLSLSVSRREV